MTKTSLSILLALSAVPSLAQTSYTNPEKSSDVACFGLPCFVKAKRTSPEFVKTSWDPYCQQIGNTTFGSEGSSTQRIGKTTFINDGGGQHPELSPGWSHHLVQLISRSGFRLRCRRTTPIRSEPGHRRAFRIPLR